MSQPPGFLQLLGRLPEGAEIVEAPGEPLDVILLFVTGLGDLSVRFKPLSQLLVPAGGLWVAWPKKSSKIDSDLTFELVQQVGLSGGLVDNKSCTIDRDWQALRFVYRKKDRSRPGSGA
ncbi:MAG TPA: DUF3052 domain-containing protein [Actinomycetota bacterium]|nr:DUF3052 domain-containing protein [Actinomycetota bacterium]